MADKPDTPDQPERKPATDDQPTAELGPPQAEADAQPEAQSGAEAPPPPPPVTPPAAPAPKRPPHMTRTWIAAVAAAVLLLGGGVAGYAIGANDRHDRGPGWSDGRGGPGPGPHWRDRDFRDR